MKSWRILLLVLLPLVACLTWADPVAAVAGAAVQNDSMWIDSLGALHIFGEVKNTGDVWLRFVKVTGTLRDSTGAIVDVTFTYTLLSFVPPDAVAPFNMIEIDTAKSARVGSYSLLLEFQEATALSQQLAVLNVADSKNSLGWLEVVGEVENRGTAPSEYTQVAGAFYDVDGKVIYVHFTYTDPSEIPPGAKHPFKITLGSDERSSKIIRYAISAESENSGYTSVPETPSPTILMVAAFTVAALVLRRKRPEKINWPDFSLQNANPTPRSRVNDLGG